MGRLLRFPPAAFKLNPLLKEIQASTATDRSTATSPPTANNAHTPSSADVRTIAIPSLECRNPSIIGIRQPPPAGLCVYNPAVTTRLGLEEPVISEHHSLKCIALVKILAVGPVPTSDTPSGRALKAILAHVLLHRPSDTRGKRSNHRVVDVRLKPCQSPKHTDTMCRSVYRPTSRDTSSTTMLPPTSCHRSLSVSASNRSRTTDAFATVVVPSRSCANLAGS